MYNCQIKNVVQQEKKEGLYKSANTSKEYLTVVLNFNELSTTG